MSQLVSQGDDPRTHELEGSLRQVRERIAQACRAAGRDPNDVTLVVITKFFDVADAARLIRLGVSDLGESRDQEASAKVADLGDDRSDVRLHFVGQVQSKKAGSIAGYADEVHSVDRAKVVTALDRGAARHARRLRALIQVNLATGDSSSVSGAPRGGVSPDQVPELCGRVADSERLDLGGVMAVAPREESPRLAFERLAQIATEVQREYPQATTISAGMSGDLEDAVLAGATHVRVGSAILGPRPRLG